MGFATVAEEALGHSPATFLDLGTGGGLPGFVLLDRWSNEGHFLDSMERRTVVLQEIVSWPDCPGRGIVHLGRAENLGRESALRGHFPLVTARSFGPPAVVAECAAAFLEVGGVLIVSEPPLVEASERWEADGLHRLGLRAMGLQRHGAGYQVIVKDSPTPEEYPRRVGLPSRRPLF